MINNIEELIKKYNAGQCTEDEAAWLEQWYHSFEWSRNENSTDPKDQEGLQDEIWLNLERRMKGIASQQDRPITRIAPLRFKKWHRYAIAAMVVLIVGIWAAVSYINTGNEKSQSAGPGNIANRKASPEIVPGTSKAQLQLSDGSIISLDSSLTMQLKERDGTSIDKQYGELVYKNNGTANGNISFNTLSTPRGGEYQVTLPDGSQVWLNSLSSLKFPTRFADTREVLLEGEAYFIIAKDSKKPFKVKLINGTEVVAIGTQFNIMAYEDEDKMAATLEEGVVKVSHQFSQVMLSPSHQAVLKRANNELTVKVADVNKELAWKNGMIEFDGEDLPYIMRQLSRWYDMEISFSGKIPRGTYKGAIRRKSPLASVLEILKVAGVNFKIDGKRLIVQGG